MNRKGFIGSLLALIAAPKIIKEDCEPVEVDEIKDYLKLEGFVEGEPIHVSFRDLLPTKTINGSELHFVRYRETKTSGLIT